MKIERIGIISKPEHASALCKALSNKTKYRYRVLGGDPGLVVPPSCDVIVCRPKSVGHEPMWTALSIARLGTVPVIFENGTTRILEQLRLIEKGLFKQSYHLAEPSIPVMGTHIEAKNAEAGRLRKKRSSSKKRTQKQALADLIELGGFFFSHMTRLGEQKSSLLMQTASTYGDVPCWVEVQGDGLKRLDSDPHKALHEVFAGSDHNPRNNLADLRKTGRYCESTLWMLTGSRPTFRRATPFYVLSQDPIPKDRLDFICGYVNAFPNKEEARAALKAQSIAVKAPEPVPEPVPEPSSEDDVSTLLDMLYEAVKAKGMRHIEHEHFTLELKVKHLPRAGIEPWSSACDSIAADYVPSSRRYSMSLSEVTCEDCAKTPAYHEMVWILENMDY